MVNREHGEYGVDGEPGLTGYRVRSGLVTAEVMSPPEVGSVLNRYAEKESEWLPGGFTVTTKNVSELPDQRFEVRSAESARLYSTERDMFILEGPVTDAGFVEQVPHVIYSVGEQERQRKYQTVTMHAAAVCSPRGEGVLILGDKGAGKTSLALALAEYGYELVGNDLIAVQGDEVSARLVGGSVRINMRQAVGERLGLLKERAAHPYESKTSAHPSEIGMGIAPDSVPVSAVVRVSIHDRNPELLKSEGPSIPSELLRIRENASRYIRGITTPLHIRGTEPVGIFPSLDTPAIEEWRNRLLGTLLRKPFWQIAAVEPETAASEVERILTDA